MRFDLITDLLLERQASVIKLQLLHGSGMLKQLYIISADVNN